MLATGLWLRRAKNNLFGNLLIADEAINVALREYDRLIKELQEELKRSGQPI
jgi:predicted sulfurtransferase